MNNERINEQIKNVCESRAQLDFADLLKRIENDNGRSTAPQMSAKSVSTGRIIGVAAGIVAVTALSAVTIAGVSNGMAKNESEVAMDSTSSDYSINEFYPDMEAAPQAPGASIDDSVSEEVSEDPNGSVWVSDGDVSDTDVSASDAGEE